MGKNPLVSIVIPTKKNREKTLKNLLKSIRKLDYDNFEVIIVKKTDKTKEVVKHGKVKLIKIPLKRGRTANKQRNIGVKNSKGSIIAFTDDDCEVDKKWLKELINGFTSKEIAIVGGSVFNIEKNIYSEFAELSIFPVMRNYKKKLAIDSSNFGKVPLPIGCNFSIKRSVLKKVGYLDENTPSYDEVELFWRIVSKGYKIFCTGKSKVWHHYVKNLRGLMKKYFRYGRGFGYFSKKYSFPKGTCRKLFLISIVIFFLFYYSSLSLIFALTRLLGIIILLSVPLIIFFLIHLIRLIKHRKMSLIFHFLLFPLTSIMYVLGTLYSWVKK